MTDLMHYAAQPVTFDPTRTYQQDEPRSEFGKPHGIWVSVAGEDDWPSWCLTEMSQPNRVQHAHRVILHPGANVHRITNPVALDAFTGTYAVQTDWQRTFQWTTHDKRHWPIDWRRVAKDCDGIVIAPYQWTRRMVLDWYYGWDCASGCIWNLDAIAAFEPVESTVGVTS